ncbi:hypothetical protein AB6A40_008573 [Gnathostoma spinigerum]|uniref:Myotubularin phosphatase domain-containing protein n=1 Tax=Gnathostoma spinigerum TaxID=75299 RepID=A0ABD6EUK2_9BILA
MCAVELSMRSVIARVALCQLLWVNLSPVSRATLLPQQFELLIRLINCALEQESREDEHGIAYAMLHLSNIYCRRLTPGVHQFAYTCIQDHDVWDNQQFWEAAFFHDVHRQLRRLYGDLKINNDCPFSLKENVCDTWNLSEEPSCMDIASERLANLSKLNEVEIRQKAAEENSIVFGQAKHYINLMVYLQVPLDVSKLRRVNVRELERKFDRNLKRTDSDDETEYSPSESDIGSGFMESDCNDLGSSAVKWISRLIDRICSAAGLDQSQIGRLCGEIPGFVALHIDNLEQVYTESKRLSPMHKPKLLQPALLTPSESVIVGGLRVFLLNDGRVTSQQACDQQIQNVLPAEGAIFLTNYRVIFKGQPCDPFFSEQVAIRTMAIMSIMKEKQISDQLIQEVSQRDGIRARIAVQLHDAFQIRSTSFQLMKIAFDEEVSSVKAEEFIQTLMTLRWPVSLPHTMFAFSAASSLLSSTLATSNSKHKYQTMKDLKKALMRNPLKDKKRLTTRPTATKFPSRDGNGGTLPAVFNETSSSLIYSGGSSGADYLDLSGAMDYSTSNLHRHYLIDYDRLGLIHRPYRLSNVIHRHDLSKGYPAVIVLPSTVMDENLFKISKGFKHGRFPVITWKSEDDALLIRGAGFASQTVVARLKKQANLLAYPEQQQSALGGSRLSVYNRDNSSAISIEGQDISLQSQLLYSHCF